MFAFLIAPAKPLGASIAVPGLAVWPRRLVTMFLRAGLLLGLAVLFATGPATAHSFKEIESSLREREIYFEPKQQQPAPAFELQDAQGTTVRLADFRDKIVILHFVYASCPDACPLHAERIAEVQAMVNRTPMKDLVQFVTITTDPVRDTPEVLKGYGPAHGLDAANWVFLTSGSDNPTATRELAEKYGLRFTEMPDGEQMHAAVTHVIDKNGDLRARFHGLEFSTTNMVVYINALLNDHGEHGHPQQRSIWQKLWSLFRS